VREEFSNFEHQAIPLRAIRRVRVILAGYGEQPMRAIEAGIAFISHFRGSESQMTLTPLVLVKPEVTGKAAAVVGSGTGKKGVHPCGAGIQLILSRVVRYAWPAISA
jgi:hypothetical protein